MGSPKRNDPCPCGSRKKFKKCCGKNNLIAFDSSLYKKEIDRLYADLIDFTFGQFEQEFFEIVKHFMEEYFPTSDEKEIDIYSELVMSWAIFNIPLKKEKTMFDLFYEKVKNKIKYPAVRKTFSSWPSAPSGVFEVFPAENYVKLRDIITGKHFKTPLNDEHGYEQGNLAIGTLIPYADTYDFFIMMIQLPGKHLREVTELIEEKLPIDVTMGEVFPQLLADLLQLGKDPAYALDQFDWNNYDHEIVAHIFKEHAIEKGYDEELIYMTIQYWSDYCNLKHPTIRKHAANTAALDYFSQVEFLPFTKVTQSQLAREYGTSAGTISNHYNKLSDEFDNILDVNGQDTFTSPPLNMEKQMRDLMRFIGEQEFESEEELNNFLQRAMHFDDLPSSENPRDIAQDLLFDAGEASGAKRKRLIQQALEIHPLSSDAYLLLAEDERDMDRQRKLLEKAIDVGEQDLGDEFFEKNRGHFWGIIETRPYMRAKANYGMALERLGLAEEAIDEYIDLLELNPNDNQGIRYMLLPLYLMEEDFQAVHALVDKYNESSAAFMFSKALLHFEENGITKEGLKALREASDCNPYVIDYLLNRKKIPNERPKYVGFGDETEAILYVQENGHLWMDAEEYLHKV